MRPNNVQVYKTAHISYKCKLSKSKLYSAIRASIQEGRATAKINTYGKFREVWNAVFEICELTDRQLRSLQYLVPILGTK